MFADNQDNKMTQDENRVAEQGSVQGELEKCSTDLKNLKDAYALMLADFENYKKRVSKDNERILFNAQSGIINKFLPIVDNISRFIKTIDNSDNNSVDLRSWKEGLVLIEKEIQKTFESLDIKQVQMETFDPEMHEAIAYVHVEGKIPGDIVDFVEKGYTYKGILLRAAKVAVSQ